MTLTTILMSISAVLVALILGAAWVLVSVLKYRESAELGAVMQRLAEVERNVQKADTKEVKERLAAIEARAGVRMF